MLQNQSNQPANAKVSLRRADHTRAHHTHFLSASGFYKQSSNLFAANIILKHGMFKRSNATSRRAAASEGGKLKLMQPCSGR
jgi:hypothetical protein